VVIASLSALPKSSEMPRTSVLAEAHQRCRDLNNRLHESEQKLQPLREELRAAQAERDRALADASRLERRNTVLQTFVMAFIELTHELASDKD
jgi:chromosome segregation ATPase